jgi:hypothetical protein
VADSDLKKNEELLQRQKNTRALARQILEDKKVITMRMKLEKSKEYKFYKNICIFESQNLMLFFHPILKDSKTSVSVSKV